MSFLSDGGTQRVIQPSSTEQITPDLNLPVSMQVLGHYLTMQSMNDIKSRSGFWGQDWTQFLPQTPLGGQVQVPGMNYASQGPNGYPTWGGNAYATMPGGIAPAGQVDFASMLSRDPGLYTQAGKQALASQPQVQMPQHQVQMPQPQMAQPRVQMSQTQPYNAGQQLAQNGVNRMNVGGITG